MSSWVDPERVAREWHWSTTAPVHTVPVSDPDLPDPLVAAGRWDGLVVQVPGRGTRTLSCDDPRAYLAFDEAGMLYLLLPPAVRAVVRREFWREGARTTPLAALARQVGGRHTRGDYADVEVQPIGPIVTVLYRAKKYGEGAERGATFFHDHDPVLPWACCDARGRLWYAGGSYDALPNAGITG